MGELVSIYRKWRTSSGWDGSWSLFNVQPVVGYINNYQNYVQYRLELSYGTNEVISKIDFSYDLWSTQGSGRTVKTTVYVLTEEFTGSSITSGTAGYECSSTVTCSGVNTAAAVRADVPIYGQFMGDAKSSRYIYLVIASDSTNVQTYSFDSGSAHRPDISITYTTETPAETYTISYTGGLVNPDPQTKTEGVAIQLAGAVERYPTITDYTLNPKANGGTLAPGTVSGRCRITSEFTFSSWLSSADKRYYVAGASYNYDADAVMQAMWNISMSTDTTLPSPDPTKSENSHYAYIYYNFNYGSSTNVRLESFRTKSYTFDGWYTDATDGFKITNKTQFNGDTDIYAHWSGGSYSGNATSVTLPTPGSRYGYTFAGYSTDSSATAPTAQAGEFTPNSESTIYFYAVWWHNYHNLIFNATGGSVDPSSKQISFDRAYGSLPTPTRTNYTFVGWYTEETGGDEVTASTVLTVDSDVTIYARWSLSTSYGYKISFDKNGGTGTAPDDMTVTGSTSTTHTFLWDSSSVNLINGSSQFIGWSVSPAGSIIPGGTELSQYKLTNNVSGSVSSVILYARYEENKGIVKIRTSSGWVNSTPYIRVGSEWVRVTPYVRSGSDWKIGN